MAPKKKFYAVAAGANPGIYENWPDAQAQVKGFAGAVYKSFPSRTEAEKWLQNPGYEKKAAKTGKITAKAHPDRQPEKNELIIYTDGGSINNPGPGGYGVVIVGQNSTKELHGGFRLTTNNRMELMACIVALREIKTKDKKITLFSDSSYVVNGMTKGWAKNWRRNGWIKSDRKPAVNPDLWSELLDLAEGLDVRFNWVKGHAGNPLNERCDQLAVASARQADLPPDNGYKGENGY